MASDYLDLDETWKDVDTLKALEVDKSYKIQNTNNGKPLTFTSLDDGIAYLITAAAAPATPAEHRQALKSSTIISPAGFPHIYDKVAGENLYAIAPQGKTSISIEKDGA